MKRRNPWTHPADFDTQRVFFPLSGHPGWESWMDPSGNAMIARRGGWTVATAGGDRWSVTSPTGKRRTVARFETAIRAASGPKQNPRRKREHPIAAAKRLGEQFHAWQGAGLRKAIRLIMPRRNPDTALHFTDLGDLYRAAVRATERSDALDRENQARVDAGGVPDKAAITQQTNLIAELKAWVDGQDWFAYNGEAKPLLRWPTDAPWFRRRVARNPAGWQHAEASTAVRRAVKTGTLADRQAAATALARLASKRRPSPIPNPRRNPSMRTPVENMKTHVAAIRRAIRKEVARITVEGEHGPSKWGTIGNMIARVSWTGEPGEYAALADALEAEARAAREEATAARRAYRAILDAKDAEDHRLHKLEQNRYRREWQ